jgi:hypothetical protein
VEDIGLERKNTWFGLRGATPNSDNKLSNTRSLVVESSDISSKKLRKRSRADEALLNMRWFSRDRDGKEAGTSLKSLYLPQAVSNVSIKDSLL